jgi:lipopolysaccharide export LptBFGC system permease protein LptF
MSLSFVLPAMNFAAAHFTRRPARGQTGFELAKILSTTVAAVYDRR